MAKIDWIKLKIEFLSDEKIAAIESMPECDTILIIFVKLLLLAGKINDMGRIYLTNKMSYTDEMLANILRRKLNSVRLALKVLSDLEMIEVINNGIIEIVNWEKHQNIAGLDKVREQNRLRAKKYRDAKKKGLPNPKNSDASRDVTQQKKRKKESKKQKEETDTTKVVEEKGNKPSSPPTVLKFNSHLEQLLHDDNFLSITSMQLKFSPKDEFTEIKELAKSFNDYKKSLEELTHKDYRDYRKNFRAWLSKKKEVGNGFQAPKSEKVKFTPRPKYLN